MNSRLGPALGALAVLVIGVVAAFVLLTQDKGDLDGELASTAETDGGQDRTATSAATSTTAPDADPASPSTLVATASTFQRTDDTVEDDETSPDALESVPEDGTADDDTTATTTDGGGTTGNGGTIGGDTTGGGAGDDNGTGTGTGGDNGNSTGGGGDDGGPPTTVATTAPTIPPPTDGACQVTTGALDGQSGVVELGGAGACGSVGATIVGVNPRDDLTGVRWGRDIRVCQRHPAADGIRVEAVTGGGTLEVDSGLSRTDAEATSAPIEALVVTFSDEASPVTGPRPIAICRTSTAELSIVHRPTG
ncbi:MAG: hypothetical protein AAGA93_06835 [Actinomycetota bacterium]